MEILGIGSDLTRIDDIEFCESVMFRFKKIEHLNIPFTVAYQITSDIEKYHEFIHGMKPVDVLTKGNDYISVTFNSRLLGGKVQMTAQLKLPATSCGESPTVKEIFYFYSFANPAASSRECACCSVQKRQIYSFHTGQRSVQRIIGPLDIQGE